MLKHIRQSQSNPYRIRIGGYRLHIQIRNRNTQLEHQKRGGRQKKHENQYRFLLPWKPLINDESHCLATCDPRYRGYKPSSADVASGE